MTTVSLDVSVNVIWCVIVLAAASTAAAFFVSMAIDAGFEWLAGRRRGTEDQ